MGKKIFNYDRETDKLPANITILIIVASIAAAVYLSFIVV